MPQSQEERRQRNKEWAQKNRDAIKKATGKTYGATQLRKMSCGECLLCDNPSKPRSRYCIAHSQERATRMAEFRNSRIKNGVCAGCNKEKTGTVRTCFNCWLSSIGKKYKISTSDLRKSWESSPKVCRYTKVTLVPGLNASIDHIIPVSRGGSKSSIDNIEWVSQLANTMKGELTPKEFISICKEIACNHG